MDKNLHITSLQNQLKKEQEARQSLEKFFELQTEEIQGLKNKIDDLLSKNISLPIQNFESFLEGSNSLDVDNYNLIKAIKETNEFIRLVIDTSPNFICVRDANGNIELINKSFAEVLFGQDREKLKQVKVSDFYNKQEEKDFFNQTEKQVIEEQKEVITQENFTDPRGEVIILKTMRKPLVTDDGQVYVLGISTDITEQVRARERLEHQEEQFRLLSENSRDIISLFDQNLKRLYVSPAAQGILGFSPDELLEKQPKDLIHPEDLDFVLRSIKQFVIGDHKGLRLQFRYLKKDGKYLWVESNVEPVLGEDGQLEKIQTSTRDITVKKTAQEALKVSEKKYKDLVNYSQAFIITHDLEGNFLSANPSYCKMIGVSEKQLLGENISRFTLEQNKKELVDYLELIQKEKFTEGVFEMLDIHQEKHYMIYDSFLVEDPENKSYVICNAQDITDRVIAERELKEAKKIAEESINLNDKFLASMSHEIRTPMQGIMGIANLLNKTTLNETQQNYLEIIQQSSDYLLVIINEILDFSKIKEGKVEIERISFDVNEVVRSVYNMQELKAEESGLTFKADPIPVKTQLMGDPYRLKQVLLNLLNNAIKFTEKGSITLSSRIIEETPSQVTIEFSVNDTGVGIAKEDLDKVFEEFSQVSSDTTRNFGGTGLGLNICQRLITRQNGRIWVESEVGKGSSFKFILPFGKDKENSKAAAEDECEIDYGCLGQLNVLFAEDNKVNVLLAQIYMSRWDFKMDIAESGKEAVSLAEKNKYDIILMDIQMPLLDGIGATELIRKFPDNTKARTPIIALTANALKNDADKFLNCGMDDYLSKPFTEEGLFLKIAKQFSIDPRVKINNFLPGEAPQQEAAKLERKGSLNSDQRTCDLAYLEESTAGDVTLIKELVMLFFKQGNEELKKMDKAVALNEINEVKNSAHKLKSSASMVGADSMRNRLIELEELASSNSENAKIRRVYDEFKDIYDQVENELKQVLLKL
jgi:PAS domain S-box-containing protein